MADQAYWNNAKHHLDLSLQSKLQVARIVEKFKEKLTQPVVRQGTKIEIPVEPEIVTESHSSLFIFLLKEKEEKNMYVIKYQLMFSN